MPCANTPTTASVTTAAITRTVVRIDFIVSSAVWGQSRVTVIMKTLSSKRCGKESVKRGKVL
jgi:hypothetical protein